MKEMAGGTGSGECQGFLFELSGGDLALDFVNTVEMRPLESRKELLATYQDACSWARQSGLVTPRQESLLKRRAASLPAEAERALGRLAAARECLFQILSAITAGEEVPGESLDQWNRLVHLALAHHRLSPPETAREKGLVWKSTADSEDLDALLWGVIHAAVMLLTGSDACRIRRCASERCDWMFLDRSKRGNRRWCDMTVCGNRAKARRYYRRKREAG